VSTCCCRVKSGLLTDSYQPVFVIGYRLFAQRPKVTKLFQSCRCDEPLGPYDRETLPPLGMG
jgi:hypothetical protein